MHLWRRLICFGSVFGLSLTGLVHAQEVREARANIDWAAARADAERLAGSQGAGLNSFRSANAANLDSIGVPVLVPGTGPVRAAPNVKGQGTAYAATYMLNAAKLSVMGTASALVPPRPEEFTALANRADARTFEQGEDGADLSFVRYGAAYVLRLSCARLDDARCTNDAFLNAVADSLLPIGGREQ